jgi:hypothetical protein
MTGQRGNEYDIIVIDLLTTGHFDWDFDFDSNLD